MCIHTWIFSHLTAAFTSLEGTIQQKPFDEGRIASVLITVHSYHDFIQNVQI